MHLEMMAVTAELARANKGQWFAFTIGLAGLGVAAVGFILGHSIEGTIVGGVTLVDLAGIFLYRYQRRQQERERKAERLKE